MKISEFLLLTFCLAVPVCGPAAENKTGEVPGPDDGVSVCAIPQLYDYLEELRKNYDKGRLDITYASATMLYASAVNGELSCDIYLGNDEKFPARYISSGLGDGSSYGYFTRTDLSLFSVTTIAGGGCDILNKNVFTKIAVPNPKLNVSGFAAMQVLEGYMKKNPDLRSKIVFSENEYAVLSSVANGYAMVGILPYNMVTDNRMKETGSSCLFDGTDYVPLRYYYMMFKKVKNRRLTEQFRDYLFGDESRGILNKHGYR